MLNSVDSDYNTYVETKLKYLYIYTVEPPLSGLPRSEGARILEFARISGITIISIS